MALEFQHFWMQSSPISSCISPNLRQTSHWHPKACLLLFLTFFLVISTVAHRNVVAVLVDDTDGVSSDYLFFSWIFAEHDGFSTLTGLSEVVQVVRLDPIDQFVDFVWGNVGDLERVEVEVMPLFGDGI